MKGEMVKVYMESNAHAEVVAKFADEETYMACLPALMDLADKHRMKITESLIEGDDNLNDVDS